MRNAYLIVHILAAATWLGAGITIGFLLPRIRRAGDQAAGAFMAGYEKMGIFVFNPAGLLVLVSGVLLVIDGPWEFEQAFVVIGIAIVVIGAVLGARVFAAPESSRSGSSCRERSGGPRPDLRTVPLGRHHRHGPHHPGHRRDGAQVGSLTLRQS